MRDIAIHIENLNVSYKELSAYSIKRMFLKGGKKKDKSFHALKNVSLDIKKGEILGIIGKNGSGKSTLLNTVAGIFAPDSGTIDLNGKKVSLLSIGVGFQKDMSGRENIVLNGLLLGFSEEEIREKMPDIIEFSELGSFIDKPVKTYSKGMYSKLAFSITAFLETDIILIDEVLSVGDEHFKKKSSAKMKELISDKNRTVLIVSHSISTLRKLCTKMLWLHDGKIKMLGDTNEVLTAYEQYM
ncbi:MAG: ABC transporter ATP-binding protein [Clostridia bacterium]|nr:ABC transporter ATP-binding protein [Clostridia bacterium]